MSDKQDRQGVRSASQLEQKYQFGKKFSEILGIANDAREKVDSVTSELRNEITENYTSIVRDTEQIVLSALENYSKTDDAEELRRKVESDLRIMAEKISMNFSSTEEKLKTVDGNLQTVVEELEKHFDFGISGLTIKAGEDEMRLVLDNGVIYFEINGQRKTVIDPDSVKTGNIYIAVEERAQFGNFAFVPRSNGSLDFLKVGG